MPQLPPPVTSSPAPKKKPPKKKAPAPKNSGAGNGHSDNGHGTPAWFAHQVLSQLGLPTTAANVNWMVAWESREGGHWGNTARYNPLNTTLAMPGSSTMNSVNVRVYTSWQQGVEATAKTLAAGYYDDIRSALATGHVSLDQHFQSLMTWSGNGYDNVSGGNPHYNPGGGGGGSLTADGSKKETGALNDPGLVSQFGYLSAYLNDPVLGGILRDYAQNHKGNTGWLLAKLETTDWWKTHAQTARELGALQKVDRASYLQMWHGQRETIEREASQMGVAIDPKRLNQLTTTSLFSGWDSGQLTKAIGAEFHYDPNAKFTGTAGQTLQKLKGLAGQYLVPLHDGTLQNWTRQILEGGKTSPDDYTNYLAQQAKTMYPWMAKAIDAGDMTPTQYLDPYRQAAAQTLELDPAAVDLSQGKWRRLFETVDDKGQRTERGLANAMTLMRTDPIYNYDSTKGAQQEAASLAQSIATSFGFAA